ncbi:MAG: hypothetical protein KA120_04300 [Candidatus Goldbacteria bacterium]|nr:hypothetical protein [Candidatus Goldiibacteriota bacterium]
MKIMGKEGPGEIFILSNPPSSPFYKGGKEKNKSPSFPLFQRGKIRQVISPLWKRGARGDFILSNPLSSPFFKRGIHSSLFDEGRGGCRVDFEGLKWADYIKPSAHFNSEKSNSATSNFILIHYLVFSLFTFL